MSKVLIAPSLLSADFSDLANEMKRVTEAGADWLHLDVMDGHFVPNLTFGMPVIKALKPHAQLPLDVHLMIDRPERYVDQFIGAGADYLTLHVESTSAAAMIESLDRIRRASVKAGITLRPKTDVNELKPYLGQVDLILIMSVEPGFGGQSFMPDQLEKVRQLVEWRKLGLGNFLIEIDGGVSAATAAQCIAAGVDVLVAGSAVFHGEKSSINYRQNIERLKTN